MTLYVVASLLILATLGVSLFAGKVTRERMERMLPMVVLRA